MASPCWRLTAVLAATAPTSIVSFATRPNGCNRALPCVRGRARPMSSPSFAIAPPVEPMLAKLADELPTGPFLYEPKWDGFRAIVFRSDSDLYIQSRDLRPLDRYF